MTCDAALIGIFVQTRYRVLSPGGTLILRVGQRAPELNAGWPGVHRFAVITAFNPGGRRCPALANQRRQRQLQARIDSARRARLPTLASAADGAFVEPGWLVCDADVAWLDALARSFGQLAVLAWRSDEPVRLRCYRADPGLSDAQSACIDFVG